MTYLIYSQYLENYEVRLKPKGGRAFVVDAPDVLTACGLVHQFLFNEQSTMDSTGNFRRSVEFPLIPDVMNGTQEYEFENASHAIMAIAEYERDDNIRLIWGQ